MPKLWVVTILQDQIVMAGLVPGFYAGCQVIERIVDRSNAHQQHGVRLTPFCTHDGKAHTVCRPSARNQLGSFLQGVILAITCTQVDILGIETFVRFGTNHAVHSEIDLPQ